MTECFSVGSSKIEVINQNSCVDRFSAASFIQSHKMTRRQLWNNYYSIYFVWALLKIHTHTSRSKSIDTHTHSRIGWYRKGSSRVSLLIGKRHNHVVCYLSVWHKQKGRCYSTPFDVMVARQMVFTLIKYENIFQLCTIFALPKNG